MRLIRCLKQINGKQINKEGTKIAARFYYRSDIQMFKMNKFRKKVIAR